MSWVDLTDATLTGDQPAFGSIPASYKARLEAGVAMPIPPLKFDSLGAQSANTSGFIVKNGLSTSLDLYVPENVNGTDGTNATGDTDFSFFLFLPIQFIWNSGQTPSVNLALWEPDAEEPISPDNYSRGPQWSPDSGTGTYNPVLYCGLPASRAGLMVEVDLLVNTTTSTANFEVNPPVGGYKSLASIRRSFASSFT